MIKEFMTWLKQHDLIGVISTENENEYFDKFVIEYYDHKPLSYIIKDILNELYTIGSMAAETMQLLQSTYDQDSLSNELNKFLKGFAHGQENEKSNKKNPKSRGYPKKSGEGKRETSQLRRKST